MSHPNTAQDQSTVWPMVTGIAQFGFIGVKWAGTLGYIYARDVLRWTGKAGGHLASAGAQRLRQH